MYASAKKKKKCKRQAGTLFQLIDYAAFLVTVEMFITFQSNLTIFKIKKNYAVLT